MFVIRAAVAAVSLGVLAAGAPAAAAQTTANPTATSWAVTMQAPATAMAHTDATFRFAASPAAKAAGLKVGLQVRSAALGWYTTKRAVIDTRGTASISLTRKATGKVEYRAVLYSSTGRALAYSARTSVTWTALKYAVSLRCDKSASKIRVNIPCTITVIPSARLSGVVARLQVMGMTDWVPVDSFRVPNSGVIDTDVEGYAPGVGKYRVLLVRSGKLLATSNTFSIAYSS